MKEEKKNTILDFLANLKKSKEINAGDLAILKRASGNTLSESTSALSVFYKYLPPPLINTINEEIYFLIATLYSINDFNFEGGFGKTMRKVYQKTKSDSISKRMIAILNSHFELLDNYRPGGGDLAYRLRQGVKLAASHEVGVDWYQLIYDLSYWTHENKFIQKKWAQEFFSEYEPNLKSN